MKTLQKFLVILVILAPSLYGQDSILIGGFKGIDPLDTLPRYSIRLALSGGGARGLASIGILNAFEEKRIQITAIAGTSIGGIIGGLYACGYNANKLQDFAHKTNFSDLFTSKPSRMSMFLSQRQERDRHLLMVRFDGLTPHIPQGYSSAQSLSSILSDLTMKPLYHANCDFNRLPIPFKTVSTDIVSGQMQVFSDGSLADAMRATMAFPLAFTGLNRGNQVLMDGGMVSPVPVKIVKTMGETSDMIVAVNTTSPLLPKDKLVTPVDIANQVTSIMTSEQLQRELAQADFIIKPLPDNIASLDFSLHDSIISYGYKAGLIAADSIISLINHSDSTHLTILDVVCQSCPAVVAEKVKICLSGKTLTPFELQKVLQQIVVEAELFDLKASLKPEARKSPSIDSKEKSINLFIEANPSLHTNRTRFRFLGNSLYDSLLLVQQMDIQDSLITCMELRHGLDHIVNLYQINGYDLADIRSVAIDFDSSIVTINIDEAVVQRIDVNNNHHVRDWLIRSYCPLEVGRPFSSRLAKQGVTNIYGTDLFDRVTIEPVSQNNETIMVISVEEKENTQIRFGWHWHDEYQSEEFIELLNDNMFGIGIEYLTHIRYGDDRQIVYGELKSNRIFSTYLTGRFQAFYNRLERQMYKDFDTDNGIREEIVAGGSFRIGQQIKRLGMASASLIAKELTYKYDDTGTREHYSLRELGFESLVETFDRLPFPNSGKKHHLELVFSGKFIGGDVEFTKLYSSIESYFSLVDGVVYHPLVAIGLSRTGLPPSEKFYLGGLHSFSGFRTDQLNGDKMFLASNELRFKLPFRFYLTGRYDMGEVYTLVDQIKLRNLRHGIGLILSYDSPLGPIEFGYGISSHHNRSYFSAGLDF